MKNQNFLLLIIVVLIGIIFLQRACDGPGVTGEPGKDRVDTTWQTKDSLIIKKVPVYLRDTNWLPGDSVFVPDTNYVRLKQQYIELAKNYAVRNIYKDTVSLDSFGNVYLTDTVQYNQLAARQTVLSYKFPVITKTIAPKPRRQVYVGGGLHARPGQDVQLGVQAGILYKNKKDQIFGAYTVIDGLQTPFVGVSSYWKIKLK